MHPSLCKVCLAWNRKTQFIENNKLREIFEKLTNLQIETGFSVDRMCCACYWQLQKCFKFADLAQRSNGILRELRKKSLEARDDSDAFPTATIEDTFKYKVKVRSEYLNYLTLTES